MNENFSPEEAHWEGLKELMQYIDGMAVLTPEQKEKLKYNIQYPGIQEQLLEVKYILEGSKGDPNSARRGKILLDSLLSDLRALPTSDEE